AFLLMLSISFSSCLICWFFSSRYTKYEDRVLFASFSFFSEFTFSSLKLISFRSYFNFKKLICFLWYSQTSRTITIKRMLKVAHAHFDSCALSNFDCSASNCHKIRSCCDCQLTLLTTSSPSVIERN